MREQEKIIVVTKQTRLQELETRFNTRKQAQFYIEHMGLSMADYEREHEVYQDSLKNMRTELARFDRKVQLLDRGFLPNFIFAPSDVVLTVGPDGLVVNTAKYLTEQPLIAVNPDPERIDGILVPFDVSGACSAVSRVFAGSATWYAVTMAEAVMNTGERILAFNDLMVGHRTHVSARYTLKWNGKSERQSSSGVLVSTGAGSTGWLSSTQHMAEAVNRLLLGKSAPTLPRLKMGWEEERLAFIVREPFASRASGTKLSAGILAAGEELRLESQMPSGGVLFSDGIESDALDFLSGSVATIRASKQKARLVRA